MLCALTVRRLKPGTWAEFRRAWEPERWPPGSIKAYHVRNLEDENEIVSFGLFEGTVEDFQRWREENDPDGQLEARRQERMAEFVESTGVDAIFEVIDEVTPSGFRQ